ncbi:MAG TPA: chloride channel protein [Anaeromyxobacteraceae bacterium]|nr:chloride channel protein [Anaeromyxobacteraceae bacterium]
MQSRPANESPSPFGRSLGESLTLGRHLLLVAAPLGVLVGLAIAGYDWVVNELLWRRVTEHSVAAQIVAPFFGMLLAGVIVRLFRVPSPSMADEVVKAYHDAERDMPLKTAAWKLTASFATMGFGGSAGMEGASKWLGATIGSGLQGLVNRLGPGALRWSTKSTLIVGGSAGIAAIFRAPLSGAIMGVESPYKRDLAHEALIPALVASATSFWTFAHFRPATPYFPITFQYALNTRDLLVALPLGVAAGLASHLFLTTLARLRRRFDGLRVAGPVRYGLGGLLLVAIAWVAWRVVGAPVTLQAGLPVSNALLNGRFGLWAALAIFGLKLLATSVTFGAGGVGGLFVPSATMGAALGAAFDAVFAPSHPGVFTLLGIAAFSGASYNSLLFSAVFVAESTGNVALVVPSLVASTVAFVVAAGVSNSRSQRLRRQTWRERLREVPVTAVMTRQLVTARPEDTLEVFSHSVLLEHHFKALPVVDEGGMLKGMIALAHLRTVPMTEWRRVQVAEVMDPDVRFIRTHDAVADAEGVLREGPYDYVPVVDPTSDVLVGIVSDSDIYRSLGEHATHATA